MSKRKKQKKVEKQIENENNKYRELIKDLLYGLDEYGVHFQIVKNNLLKNYEDSDNQFLKCPFAVEYSIPQSEKYCSKLFKGRMYLNENGSGFVVWHEDYTITVDNPAWFFVEYANFLEQEVGKLNY